MFTRDELIAAFTLEGISGGNAVFNPEKLDWFNQQHIGAAAAPRSATRIEPQLREAGLWRDTFAASEREWLLRVIELLKPRVKKLGQIVEEVRSFLAGAVRYDDPGRWRSTWQRPGLAAHLRAHCTRRSPQLNRSIKPTIESVLRALAERARDQGGRR